MNIVVAVVAIAVRSTIRGNQSDLFIEADCLGWQTGVLRGVTNVHDGRPFMLIIGQIQPDFVAKMQYCADLTLS